MGSTGTTSLGSIAVDVIGSRALDKKLVRMGYLLAVLCLCCCVKPVCSIEKWSGPGAVALVPEIGTYGPLKTLGMGQLPEGQVKKVFVIFKPSNNTPFMFWDYSPSCLQCTGTVIVRVCTVTQLACTFNSDGWSSAGSVS